MLGGFGGAGLGGHAPPGILGMPGGAPGALGFPMQGGPDPSSAWRAVPVSAYSGIPFNRDCVDAHPVIDVPGYAEKAG